MVDSIGRAGVSGKKSLTDQTPGERRKSAVRQLDILAPTEVAALSDAVTAVQWLSPATLVDRITAVHGHHIPADSALPEAEPDAGDLQETVARVVVEQSRVADVSGQDLHRLVTADLLDLPNVDPAIGCRRHEARPQRVPGIARRIEPGG